MEKLKTFLIVAVLLAAAFMIAPTYTVKAQETLVWGGNVFSSGETVTSTVLESGSQYRIVAGAIFWYDYANDLEADVQYYTTDTTHWNWVNSYPAPNGHSFLQINEMDQNWGPFSNGDTGHTYSINYVGEGEAIRFRIVDWVDGDYSNNNCHFNVYIYLVEETNGKVTGGGQCVVGENDKIPSASFGFNAMWFSRNPTPNGEINYVDHITGQHVHVHELTYLVVWQDAPGNKPWPMQKAKFGGIDVYSGQMVDVYVEDNGEPGKNDKFLIFLNGEYLGGSGDYFGSVLTDDTILAGNIQIHKPPK